MLLGVRERPPPLLLRTRERPPPRFLDCCSGFGNDLLLCCSGLGNDLLLGFLIAAQDSGTTSSSAAQDSTRTGVGRLGFRRDVVENCSTLFVVGEENILIVTIIQAPKKEGFVVISRVDIYFQMQIKIVSKWGPRAISNTILDTNPRPQPFIQRVAR